MSELINTHDSRATIRWKLLTGASALALTAYVASAAFANAEDADRPQVWIELGGQLDILPGMFGKPVTAPFLLQTPTPSPFQGQSPISAQHAPRYALDLDGKITFQPEDSDWVFSAGIRYGRSHGNKHVHQQTAIPTITKTRCVSFYGVSYCFAHPNSFSRQKFADTTSLHKETHTVLDFQAGKDVGLGLTHATSTVNFGVRFAQFSSNSGVVIHARPTVYYTFGPPKYITAHKFDDNYFLSAHAQREFSGIGPLLSWNGSAVIAGNMQDGELVFDWGVDAALLFGRQKAKTDRLVTASHYANNHNVTIYPPVSNHSTRSRRVTVPDIGATAGLSVKYPNFKISVGYRYESFINAMDTGLDAAKKSNVTFHGPYASISIGLGD